MSETDETPTVDAFDYVAQITGLQKATVIDLLTNGWRYQVTLYEPTVWVSALSTLRMENMPVPVEASDVAVGDFSTMYGTVTSVVENKDQQTQEVVSYDITFFNGTVLAGTDPTDQIDLVQGWNDGNPEGSIRPGLAEDHENDG